MFRMSQKVLLLVSCCLIFTPLEAKKEIQISKDFFKNLKYRSIGPTRQSGRFVDFAVSRQNSTTFYAATASGGLWKTINNGITFKPLFENQPIFSIGDIAIAPTDENILYLGSGEANNSRSTYWGDGVYKSTDAGKTWKNMGLFETHHIGRILIHPHNPDIVYVAALGHLYSHNSERGLYQTEDGGKTWKKTLEVKVKDRYISVVDIAMNLSNPNVLYACSYDRHRRPWTYDIGGSGSRIYKTTDGGKTWKKLSGGLPGGLLGRIGIAVYHKNPNILYATIENVNKPQMSAQDRWHEIQTGKSSQGMIGGEVYRSDDAGSTWRKVNPDKKSIGGAPAYYYGQIIIDPNNDKIVHIMSAASWGTYDGGKTWKRKPLQFGGDDHALWIDPDNSNHMLLGYDHGMGITYDGGKNWYHPDNLSLGQFYAIGLDMAYPYNIAGGTQDNGSLMGPSTKKDGKPILLEDWKKVGGGDGMYNVFDWTNNRYLYNESQFGPISRLDLVTGERKNIKYKDKKLRYNWNAPILVSPHNSNVIYHGANKLLKSSYRGENWEVYSPDLSTNNQTYMASGKGGDGNIQYCTITTIDESPIKEDIIWVGTDDGNLWVRNNKKWKKLNANIKENPGYWISRVCASNHSTKTAYISFNGYRRDDFNPYLYKTVDLGETWVPINNGLPNAPVNVIKECHLNPNLLFAGTDLGVYVTLNGGKNWINFELNMPRQPVHDLQIHPRENDLVVATHGRGIYILDISPLQELNQKLVQDEDHFFKIRPRVIWDYKNLSVTSSTNFKGESEKLDVTLYYYLKQDRKVNVTFNVYQGTRLINSFQGASKKGLHKIYWDKSRLKKRTKKEKEEIKKRMERYKRYGNNLKVDLDHAHIPVKAGTYTVEMVIGLKKFYRDAILLKDVWTEK